LARHGQTVWNAEHRPQGQLDSPLTDLGWRQAAAHAERLSAVPFVRAYTSPLGRARLTAERILQGRNIALNVLDDLAELNWGELAGLLAAEREARFPALLLARAADKWQTPVPGGESYASARPRAARAVKQIHADGPGEVLVVGHEMIGRLLRMELCGLSEAEALRLQHRQDTVFRFENGQETSLS
jgi:broad specificity phosphatase PhoE